MRSVFTRKHLVGALAFAALACASFAFGFSASTQLKRPPDATLRRQYLVGGSDASLAVRLQVLDSLRAFQNGYVKRNPDQLEAFMSRLFAKDNDVLLIGTDATEWRRGYDSVASFIKDDWLKWGDLTFNVDDALVWSAGDVAWTATTGAVHLSHGDRPLRFTTILTLQGGAWVFRLIHFQWDEREPSTSDLFHFETQLQIAKMFRERLRQKAHSLFTSPEVR